MLEKLERLNEFWRFSGLVRQLYLENNNGFFTPFS